jgi:hypothetical protein
MVAFQFYLQSGKQRKVGWVGDNNHVVYGKKFPGGNSSVRQCVVVMQQPVPLSPKISRCTDSQDMLVLSTTIASCYYNCCTDGSSNPRNYAYPIMYSKYAQQFQLMLMKPLMMEKIGQNT